MAIVTVLIMKNEAFAEYRRKSLFCFSEKMCFTFKNVKIIQGRIKKLSCSLYSSMMGKYDVTECLHTMNEYCI